MHEKGALCSSAHQMQKYNAYLKEIGDMAEIPKDKPLVSHLATKNLCMHCWTWQMG